MGLLPLVATLLGGLVILIWRIRETQRPLTARLILIPPLGMTTGFLMFLAPQTRVPVPVGLAAFFAGAIFLSYPLIRTSTLTRSGDAVLLQRSRWFLVILLALLVVRLAARHYVEQYVDVLQTGSVFFLVAYGMLVPWRVAMYLRYRALMRVREGSALSPRPPLPPVQG